MARAVVGLFVVYVGFWSLYSDGPRPLQPVVHVPADAGQNRGSNAAGRAAAGNHRSLFRGSSPSSPPAAVLLRRPCRGQQCLSPSISANRLMRHGWDRSVLSSAPAHFIGTYEYRVTLTLADGRQLEPVQALFNDDKTAGPYTAGRRLPALPATAGCTTSPPICQGSAQQPEGVPRPGTPDARPADPLLDLEAAAERSRTR